MSAKPQSSQAASPAADMVTIEIDGKRIETRKGSMIIQAADAAGIYIPRFCYHRKLSIAANCRMCLVDVEKATKPLPACATPVADGMKIYTRSEKARGAQKGVMEFLLINHPLDCPICDQGGECPLQDQAMGYGKDVSRYTEGKRVVSDKDIGPLIATFMTRCIHCTRCVRFGREIAGVMEFGAINRGEHTEIRTFLDRSVDSELSGNVIDLCPVGALTSKPFQYKARAWELRHHAAVSPHDCVGSNLDVQTRRGKVMRVLPRVNEAINECWLSDRDRFSYEALNSTERLQVPMIKCAGQWEETDWDTALEFAARGLTKIVETHGAEQVGALAAPASTLEELYLVQKFMRALGSGNVDHRLRQTDFSDDDSLPAFPWLGQPIADLENLDAALLIGANPRKDQPLIGHRLRTAYRKGAKITAINPVDYDFAYRPAAKIIAAPAEMLTAVAGVAKALSAVTNKALPASASWLNGVDTGSEAQAIAEIILAASPNSAVLFGQFAATHPHAARLRAAAELVAELGGAKLGFLSEANSAGAWLAGCVPHRAVAGQAAARTGRTAGAMLRESLKAYLLFGVEPELDALDGGHARAAMQAAEFVIMLTSFKPSVHRNAAVEYADVWLPLAPFTETAGTFVNAEGRQQSFDAAVRPLGDARPGWKILRVLGNEMDLPGFAQSTIDDVRGEIALSTVAPSARLGLWRLPEPPPPTPLAPGQLTRIAEVPIYAVDALVRRAPGLQNSADNSKPAARMNATQARALGLDDGDPVLVRMLEGDARLDLIIDKRVPDGCVLVPAGYPETAGLGGHGPASVVRA